jgi:hypothetical protein
VSARDCEPNRLAERQAITDRFQNLSLPGLRGFALYYRWSKEFLEAGKKRLAGDTAREATSDEVKELKAEARQLKETLAVFKGLCPLLTRDCKRPLKTRFRFCRIRL